MLLVNNLTTGLFDLYDFAANTLSKSFSVSSSRKLIKPCLFAEGDASTAVFGSDDGHVYVFDIHSGALLQRLEQDDSAFVEYFVSSCLSNKFYSTQTRSQFKLWRCILPKTVTS